MKHELRATGALVLSPLPPRVEGWVGGGDFASCKANLFLQISSLKMFGRSLSDCLGLLYSRRDGREHPKFCSGNGK